MNADTARTLEVTALSDLKPLAPEMAFAGPPECQSRRYCLAGLEEMYGLQFARFEPMSRPATEEALLSEEVDVGMLETTDPRLASGRLVLLADDLQLQPAENVVPFVRTAVMEQAGDRVAAALEQVSAMLQTEDLVELNREVQLEQRPPATVANDWLALRLP
jgi:osmoprotectant transport system substrate-binding protein